MRFEEVKDDLIEELNDNKKDILECSYPEDRITEMVDSAIPIYYSDQISCLNSDHSLATVDDCGLLKENPSVYDTIVTSMYEQLSNLAHTWLYEAQGEEE